MKPDKKFFRILGAVITILCLAIFLTSIALRNTLEDRLTTTLQTSGLLLSFLASALLDFLPQFIAPHFILLNASYVGLPLVQATLLIIIGSTLGATVGFAIGKSHGFNLAREVYGTEKVRKIERVMNRHGRWIVALAAVSPIPYLPIVFGSLGMSGKAFFYYGIIPRMASFIAVYLFLSFY